MSIAKEFKKGKSFLFSFLWMTFEKNWHWSNAATNPNCFPSCKIFFFVSIYWKPNSGLISTFCDKKNNSYVEKIHLMLSKWVCAFIAQRDRQNKWENSFVIEVWLTSLLSSHFSHFDMYKNVIVWHSIILPPKIHLFLCRLCAHPLSPNWNGHFFRRHLVDSKRMILLGMNIVYI